MKIGSFGDIRTCTASRFVASLDSRNFLSLIGKNALVRIVFRFGIRLLLLMFCELSNIFFMPGSSYKIGRLFLITL